MALQAGDVGAPKGDILYQFKEAHLHAAQGCRFGVHHLSSMNKC